MSTPISDFEAQQQARFRSSVLNATDAYLRDNVTTVATAARGTNVASVIWDECADRLRRIAIAIDSNPAPDVLEALLKKEQETEDLQEQARVAGWRWKARFDALLAAHKAEMLLA